MDRRARRASSFPVADPHHGLRRWASLLASPPRHSQTSLRPTPLLRRRGLRTTWPSAAPSPPRFTIKSWQVIDVTARAGVPAGYGFLLHQAAAAPRVTGPPRPCRAPVCAVLCAVRRVCVLVLRPSHCDVASVRVTCLCASACAHACVCMCECESVCESECVPVYGLARVCVAV